MAPIHHLSIIFTEILNSMKKLFFASLISILLFAVSSCGASKKLGCPAVAENISVTLEQA
jgi:hypothetical protein